jgi:hypothetical protein
LNHYIYCSTYQPTFLDVTADSGGSSQNPRIRLQIYACA